MGVRFTIILYAEDEESAERAVTAAFERVGQLDKIMSDYDPHSELNRLCRQSPTERPLKVSEDLWRVLQHGQELSRQSDGAFDVTVGPFTKLWRAARREKNLPPKEELARAREAVGYQFVRLHSQDKTVELLRPKMQLDLGGIAKGYAADEALAVLAARGIRSAMVDASGDISIGDAPPGKPGWSIGVAPVEADAPPSRVLQLANCAVATSGDAWQYVEVDGRRYSHIVDPTTGLGLTERSSVTVVARDGMTADALASAVSVLGPQRGIALVDTVPHAACLVIRVVDGRTKTFCSPRFEQLPKAKPQ